LNQIMEDIYWKGRIEGGRLIELIGHSPFQVFVGTLLGCSLSAILFHVWK